MKHWLIYSFAKRFTQHLNIHIIADYFNDSKLYNNSFL